MENLRALITAHQLATIHTHRTPVLVRIQLLGQVFIINHYYCTTGTVVAAAAATSGASVVQISADGVAQQNAAAAAGIQIGRAVYLR